MIGNSVSYSESAAGKCQCLMVCAMHWPISELAYCGSGTLTPVTLPEMPMRDVRHHAPRLERRVVLEHAVVAEVERAAVLRHHRHDRLLRDLPAAALASPADAAACRRHARRRARCRRRDRATPGCAACSRGSPPAASASCRARAEDGGRFCARLASAADVPLPPAAAPEAGAPGSSTVIGLSVTFLPSSSVGAGGTTITVGLRCISTTTTTSSATVAAAPLSAAHLIQPGPPARPGRRSRSAAAAASASTASPPRRRTSRPPAWPDSSPPASTGFDTCDRLTRPDGLVDRQIVARRRRQRHRPRVDRHELRRRRHVLGAPLATCVGPDTCSAAANGDSIDGPLSGTDDGDSGGNGSSAGSASAAASAPPIPAHAGAARASSRATAASARRRAERSRSPSTVRRPAAARSVHVARLRDRAQRPATRRPSATSPPGCEPVVRAQPPGFDPVGDFSAGCYPVGDFTAGCCARRRARLAAAPPESAAAASPAPARTRARPRPAARRRSRRASRSTPCRAAARRARGRARAPAAAAPPDRRRTRRTSRRRCPTAPPSAPAAPHRDARVLVVARRALASASSAIDAAAAARRRRVLLAHGDDVVARLAANLEHAPVHPLVGDRVARVALVAGELHALGCLHQVAVEQVRRA